LKDSLGDRFEEQHTSGWPLISMARVERCRSDNNPNRSESRIEREAKSSIIVSIATVAAQQVVEFLQAVSSVVAAGAEVQSVPRSDFISPQRQRERVLRTLWQWRSFDASTRE
jgi:hypothetical protein